MSHAHWPSKCNMGGNLSFPVADLSGRVAVVTGGNTGIGYETAKALAVMGAHTIIACRSSERATAAVERMKEEVQAEFPDRSIRIEWMLLDLGSFQSSKQFTVAFRERNLPLHILINNAAIALAPFTMTEDGYEAQFQVNHLSHMLITLELLPIMITTASHCGDCRIVLVSADDHTNGSFVPGNMNAEQSYSRLKFYCNSKLYNVMTMYTLQRRLQGVGITVSSLNPGRVDTGLITKHTNDSTAVSLIVKTVQLVLKPVYRDWKQGAVTGLNCAVNPHLNSQRAIFYSSCQPTLPSQHARNEQHQEQLWEISVNILKDHLTRHVLEQYGPSLHPEEGMEANQASEERDRQVTIVSDEQREGGYRVSYQPVEDVSTQHEGVANNDERGSRPIVTERH